LSQESEIEAAKSLMSIIAAAEEEAEEDEKEGEERGGTGEGEPQKEKGGKKEKEEEDGESGPEGGTAPLPPLIEEAAATAPAVHVALVGDGEAVPATGDGPALAESQGGRQEGGSGAVPSSSSLGLVGVVSSPGDMIEV
jgi:hypothetical protein